MDFASDRASLEIEDQYMFGPQLMVAPVMSPGARVRTVYLPGKGGWYDYWTGKQHAGQTTIVADAPLGALPLYVRAGSIIPMGPVVEYAEAQTGLPIELRVYRGADGAFTLYDDAGDGLGYEKGERAIVDIAWNEASGTLSFSERKGSYPGMKAGRVFNVVWVDEATGRGDAEPAKAETVRYTGRALTWKAP